MSSGKTVENMADISETSFDKTAETWLTNSEFSELKTTPQNAGRREGVRDFKVTFFCWLEVITVVD